MTRQPTPMVQSATLYELIGDYFFATGGFADSTVIVAETITLSTYEATLRPGSTRVITIGSIEYNARPGYLKRTGKPIIGTHYIEFSKSTGTFAAFTADGKVIRTSGRIDRLYHIGTG